MDDYESGLRAVVTQVRVLLDTFNADSPAPAPVKKGEAADEEVKAEGTENKVASLAAKETDHVASLAAREIDHVASLAAKQQEKREKQREKREEEEEEKKENRYTMSRQSAEEEVESMEVSTEGAAEERRQRRRQHSGSDCVVFRTAHAREVPEHLRIPPAAAELRARLNDVVVRVGAELDVPVYQWSAKVDEDEGGGGGGASSYLNDGHHQSYEASMTHVELFKRFVAENLPAHCNIG